MRGFHSFYLERQVNPPETRCLSGGFAFLLAILPAVVFFHDSFETDGEP